jgi:hypothetical protein
VIGVFSTFAALIAMAPVLLVPEITGAERRCGEACVLKHTYLRSDRSELFAKFPGFEKIDPRPFYKAYVACTIRQFQMIPVLKDDTDAQIDIKFQSTFDKCNKTLVSGNFSFLPKVVGVGATLEERKAILDARRRQLIITSLIEQGMRAKQDGYVARIERYMDDLVKLESAKS